MILSCKTVTALVLAAAFCAAPAARAQDPGFSDLPGTSSDKDLTALVRSLSRQVQNLESRLNALEVKSSPLRAQADTTASGARSAALEKVVTDAQALKTKLEGYLSGHNFPDPGDSRIVYWQIKHNGDWPVVVDSLKRFNSFMDAVLPRAGELSPTATAAYSDLIVWGRGRIFYRTGFGMAQQQVLALDYGAAVVPLPPDPTSPGGNNR